MLKIKHIHPTVGVSVLALSLVLPVLLLQWLNRVVEAEEATVPALQEAEGLLPSQLRTHLSAERIEGRPVLLGLHLQDIPPDQAQAGIPLTISYRDRDFQLKPYPVRRTVQWQGLHQRIPLVFQSPGYKQIQILSAAGRVLQKMELMIAALPATVFPSQWEAHRQLSSEAARWRIGVNLYHEPAPGGQRQYLQVMYDGRILERLLVSSGASGYDTPLGAFKLGFKDYYPRSHRYNDTPMPFWSAIDITGHEGEYGFHSLENGGYLYLLGLPASHGCVRLSRLPSVETDPATGAKSWGDRGGARWIYDRVPIGTPATLFKAKMPVFAYEDYARYLDRQYLTAKKGN